MIKMAEHAIDDPDKLQDCLHKMNLSSDHLLTLVNDILDFSKIESGKMELVKESFSFKELVQAICSMVNTQAKEKGVFFATEAVSYTHLKLVEPLSLERSYGKAKRVNDMRKPEER